MCVEPDGRKVRHVRGSRDWSAQHFAREAGISPTTLRRVERESGPVAARRAWKIAGVQGLEHPKDLGAVSTRYRKGTGHQVRR
jgi:transcriptional regulator with XRE-family HTH domain